MEQFAVIHFQKFKDTSKLGRHIDRTLKEKMGFVGRDETSVGIDPTKKNINEHLVPKKGSVQQDLEERIATLVKHKYRKDAVRAIAIIMTGSHEQMKKIQENNTEFERWKKENLAFVAREFAGKENIVRMCLHMDERTPHIHAIVVPVKNGKLSAAQFLNGRVKLKGLQDRYYEAMKSFGLSRGIPAQITETKRKKVGEYRREVKQGIKVIQELTKEISHFNIGLSETKQKIEEEMTNLYIKNEELTQRLEIEHLTNKNILYEQKKKQLENVKKNVNLVQHIASMGYQIVKSKTSKKWVVMEKTGDRVLVLSEKNEKGYYYYQSAYNANDKGTIVDFMLKRGYRLDYIRGLSSQHLDDIILQNVKKSPEIVQDKKMAKEIVQAKLDSWTYDPSDNYLLKRGIKRNTIEKFAIKTNSDTALFSLTLKNELVSAIVYNKKGKYFEKGLNRGVSVLGTPQIADRIVICESPIDALSYDQLAAESGNKEKIAYIATCGSISKEIAQELATLPNKKSIILAFDNDEAGGRMAQQVEEILKGKKVIRHTPNQGKDWNDVLRFMTKISQQDTQEQDRELLKHQRELKEKLRQNPKI